MRPCGTCRACCYVGEIKEINKPPQTSCSYLNKCGYGCSIYGKPERPAVCSGFNCAWKQYMVPHEDDWPDKCGVLLSLNATPRGIIGYAVELWKGAILTTGRRATADFARGNVPVIGSRFGVKPPYDTGDWVIVRDGLRHKASAIIDGPVIARLADDVGMYIRREPAWPSRLPLTDRV